MTASPAANIFTESQWHEVQRLVQTLDNRQILWLSGYLAAQDSSFADTQQANNEALEVLIAFGSETGNCEKIAQQLADLASKESIQIVVKDLASLRARQLKKYQCVLIICSTHGDGDPPEPITGFYTSLMDAQAPRLPNMRYAVLSLGDSTYEHFCSTGKQLDERLASLGAARLTFRQDCDVDYATTARQWMEVVLKTLPRGEPALSNVPVQQVGKSAKYTKDNALTVKVLDNIRLSHATRSSPVHHLELSVDVNDFAIEPGDAVGILVKNPIALVNAILKVTGLSPEQVVTIHHRTISLEQALTEECDLTIPSKNFLNTWAGIKANIDLLDVLNSDSTERKNYLRTHQILDLITHYPAVADAQSFVDGLRPLQPRLYDVANSLSLIDDELHLTVKRFAYTFQDREETGIASDYLIRLQKNNLLRIYPHRNARFHLPVDLDVPLILIADGTGMAPYRAFIQEIQASGRTHPCWLIFSEERFEDDFLYQLEWQQALKESLLERIDTVFYKEQVGRTLADALIEQQELFLNWLNIGAHIYLCGDKSRLAECENTLQFWLDQRADQTINWQTINMAKRVRRNLY